MVAESVFTTSLFMSWTERKNVLAKKKMSGMASLWEITSPYSLPDASQAVSSSLLPF